MKILGISDSILIQEGSILNTFTPKQYTSFRYLVRFIDGCWKLMCCLVSMWYISELTINWFPFLTINKRRERIYWERSGKIYNLKNNFLQEWLLLQSIMILIIFFCNLKIFTQSEECPFCITYIFHFTYIHKAHNTSVPLWEIFCA